MRAIAALTLVVIAGIAAALWWGLNSGRWQAHIVHAKTIDEVKRNPGAADMLAMLTLNIDLPESAHDISIASYQGMDAACLVCHGDVTELRAFLEALGTGSGFGLRKPMFYSDLKYINSTFVTAPRGLTAALPPWKDVQYNKKVEYYLIMLQWQAALDTEHGVLYLRVY